MKQCYLCPGNERAQGDKNPHYDSTFVFVNDYSAVKEEQAAFTPPDQDGCKYLFSKFPGMVFDVLDSTCKSITPRRASNRKMLCDMLQPIA